MVAPAIYRSWFLEVAECMAREDDATEQRYAMIEWYTADEIYHRERAAHAVGLWVEPHKVVIRSDRLDRAHVVKHELVHDLLGDGEHRSGLFRRCAGI